MWFLKWIGAVVWFILSLLVLVLLFSALLHGLFAADYGALNSQAILAARNIYVRLSQLAVFLQVAIGILLVVAGIPLLVAVAFVVPLSIKFLVIHGIGALYKHFQPLWKIIRVGPIRSP